MFPSKTIHTGGICAGVMVSLPFNTFTIHGLVTINLVLVRLRTSRQYHPHSASPLPAGGYRTFILWVVQNQEPRAGAPILQSHERDDDQKPAHQDQGTPTIPRRHGGQGPFEFYGSRHPWHQDWWIFLLREIGLRSACRQSERQSHGGDLCRQWPFGNISSWCWCRPRFVLAETHQNTLHWTLFNTRTLLRCSFT